VLFSIAATTLTLLLAAVPSSQVGLGETVVLPLAPTSVSADHLNVAMNDSGDLYVVWNSPQNPNPNLCAAEGVFLEYQATPTPHWILAGSSDVLGHPSADLFGHGSGGGAPTIRFDARPAPRTRASYSRAMLSRRETPARPFLSPVGASPYKSPEVHAPEPRCS